MKYFSIIGSFLVIFLATINAGEESPCDALIEAGLDPDCLDEVPLPEDPTDEQTEAITAAYGAICTAKDCLEFAATGTLTKLLGGLLCDPLKLFCKENPCDDLPDVPEAEDSCPFKQTVPDTDLGETEDIEKAINTICAAIDCIEENGGEVPEITGEDCSDCSLVDVDLLEDLEVGDLVPILCNLLGCVLGLLGGESPVK